MSVGRCCGKSNLISKGNDILELSHVRFGMFKAIIHLDK